VDQPVDPDQRDLPDHQDFQVQLATLDLLETVAGKERQDLWDHLELLEQ